MYWHNLFLSVNLEQFTYFTLCISFIGNYQERVEANKLHIKWTDSILCVHLFFSLQNYNGVWLKLNGQCYTHRSFRTVMLHLSVGYWVGTTDSWNHQRPILLHDNVQQHVLQINDYVLNEIGFKILFLPHLSLINKNFFQHLNNFLQETIFKTHTAAQNTLEEYIIPKTPEFYITRTNRLIYCWTQCVDAISSYLK